VTSSRLKKTDASDSNVDEEAEAFFGTRGPIRSTDSRRRQTETTRRRRLKALEDQVQERKQREAELKALREADAKAEQEAARERRLAKQRGEIRRKIAARQERDAEEQALLEETDEFAQWARQQEQERKAKQTQDEVPLLEPKGSAKLKRLERRVLQAVDQRKQGARPTPEEAVTEAKKADREARLAARRAELRREIEAKQQREAEEQSRLDATDEFARWVRERKEP